MRLGGRPKYAALVVAWYRRRPWSDAELAEKVLENADRWRGPTGGELLAALTGDRDWHRCSVLTQAKYNNHSRFSPLAVSARLADPYFQFSLPMVGVYAAMCNNTTRG